MEHLTGTPTSLISALFMAAALTLGAPANAQGKQADKDAALQPHADWALLAMASTDCHNSLRDANRAPITLDTPCQHQSSKPTRTAPAAQLETVAFQTSRSSPKLARSTPLFSNWFQGFFR